MATKRPVLSVESRKELGRKVKRLRKEGLLPATVYGKKLRSVSIKGDLKEFVSVFDKVGETSLVDLKIKDDKKARVVLLKNPQYHPVSDQLIHIDLHQVDLTEKVTVAIPVEIVGLAPAVDKGEGVLVQQVNEIEVEALPTDLPEKFVVDVSKLKKVDDAIIVSDLEVDSKKVTLQVSGDQVIVRIDALAEEEEEAPVVEEAVEGAEGEGDVAKADTAKEGESKEGVQEQSKKEESATDEKKQKE